MFHQYIGDGANIFIAIVAAVVGFIAALSYGDYQRNAKKEEEHKDKGH